MAGRGRKVSFHGSFKSKAEAQRMAERVRGERSLAAFVAPR